MTSKQYTNQLYFCWNQSLRVKRENNEESGIQISINVANASLWILIRRACVVRTLAKFLKNYLKGKNALKNQAGYEWLARKNQYCMLIYYPLNYLREDSMENLNNISYRFAGYQQYTCWVHNYLEKGVRKVIKTSVV